MNYFKRSHVSYYKFILRDMRKTTDISRPAYWIFVDLSKKFPFLIFSSLFPRRRLKKKGKK